MTSLRSAGRSPLFAPSQPTNVDGVAPIRRLLIANRGEIACRVIASCRKLNITSIAVYTEPDAQSLHVQEADQSVGLGSIDGPDGNPMLNIDVLVQAALESRADAVHPGYGFLSENAQFAQRVRDAGLLFVGPTARGMEVLGDKRQAKLYLARLAPQVPLVPGYNESQQDITRLQHEAERIGFPVLIKASAGGGGKGMRIVYNRAEFSGELERAQSEAMRSFGSSDCILEKYIQRSKHIEIQIMGDRHGNIISLLERECSVQRRHQKVLEEAPSPWLTEKLRKEISQAAIIVGKLINYESAGTVEFIVDVESGKFYFLEVNTRIQVEHPITEETTGFDIVALQFYIAAGGKLVDLAELSHINQVGHSIEARLCAEDPAQDFMPSLGRIWRWTPAMLEGPRSQLTDVRFETGISTGSEISIYFDSMIAKIVVWAPTRELAISKLSSVLAETVCIGVKTNQLFLQACLSHPSFRDPTYSTSFIPENRDILLGNSHFASGTPLDLQRTLALIPSMIFRHHLFQYPNKSRAGPFRSIPQDFRNQRRDKANIQADVVRIAGQSNDTVLVTWPAESNRLPNSFSIILTTLPTQKDHESGRKEDKLSIEVALAYNQVSKALRSSDENLGSALKVTVRNASTRLITPPSSSDQWLHFDAIISINDEHSYAISGSTCPSFTSSDVGKSQRVFVHIPALGCSLEYHRFTTLAYGESLRSKMAQSGLQSAVRNPKAPMPCKILAVPKKSGDAVEQGDVVMVLESMKTEIKMSAAVGGIFVPCVGEGDAVSEGTVLYRIQDPE